MLIHQFYDADLAHASYAILRAGRIILIDPARNPQPYYDFAALHEADIAGIIESHSHADLVSSHAEIHDTTGAVIYASALANAQYPHETFDEGDIIELADIKLKAINTPGHSTDSICIIVENENGHTVAVFTGDTLFVGDVGRPDLHESTGDINSRKEELASQMFSITLPKLTALPGNTIVYPAHGAGSLCGKNISADRQSTIERELQTNYALQHMSKQKFVNTLTADQPFVPQYFVYDVALNKHGAPHLAAALAAIPRLPAKDITDNNILIVDVRPATEFNKGHIKGAINLQLHGKFETWLGAIIAPNEPYYITGSNTEELDIAVNRAAKIGYELQIKGVFLLPLSANVNFEPLDVEYFKQHPNKFTIIDVRNSTEINGGKIFEDALVLPLPELRQRVSEIPVKRPLVIHCSGGYRSAAARSIIAAGITGVPVYDLGEDVKNFQ